MWTSFCLIVGNATLAFLVSAFIMPNDVLMGGTTGISVLLHKILPFEMETATIVLILNIILLLIGLIVLGKKFFLTTVVSSILYPVFLGIMERIPNIHNLTDNTLLAVLLGGSLLGISLGLVMRVGASTGGIDIIVLMLHKWFHWPVAIFMYICDAVVLGTQTIVFGSSENLFYGIVLLVIETIVLNQVMILGKSQTQLFIVTDKFHEVRHALLHKLEAGVTMVKIETGLLLNDQEGIICVIPPRKLYSATELIHSIDPNAFITVTQIKEVRGQGFTQERFSRINEAKKE
ncbi:MAG: YitT family protein [Ruminococcaceae bacterium]|nr:YitT family protein [Oscillospiraceae bacterium]